MGIRAFIFLGLLFASVFIASEISGGELVETEQIYETYGVRQQDAPWGGGYGGGHVGGGYRGRYGGGRYGGGYGGGRCGSYGCCGGGYICRCCTSAAEAEAYAATQAKAKPQN